RERTRMLPRAREVVLVHGRDGAPGRVRIADRGIELDLELDEAPGIQALCDHGGAEVWTRKQAGIDARGTLSRDGGPAQPLRARARQDNLVIVRSSYRAPFGTFAGTLPGGTELARGSGVMEHHSARW